MFGRGVAKRQKTSSSLEMLSLFMFFLSPSDESAIRFSTGNQSLAKKRKKGRFHTMSKLAPALLSVFVLMTAGWTLSCKPEASAPPAAQASPTAPGAQYTFGTGAVATFAPGMVASPGVMGSPAAGLVGCVGDAEPVPDEPGLRECCAKLKFGNACLGSACWAKGVVEMVRAQVQGQCSN
jgi:hypothetical protein